MMGTGAQPSGRCIPHMAQATGRRLRVWLSCVMFCIPFMVQANPEARGTDPAVERVARVFALIADAKRLESAGEDERARAVREQILTRVLEIWAVDRDRVALLWAARTLQNRLDRPTAALQAALRFLTETYRRDTRLDDDDQTRLADAVAVVGASLAAQSRAEADPEAATRCIGLRPAGLGEMIVPGVDGDDRVYLYRDGPEGQVYVAECEPADVLGPVVEEGGGGGTALWVTGLGIAALGGAAFGFAEWQDWRATDLGPADGSEGIFGDATDHLDRAQDARVAGGAALAVGGMLVLVGAVWQASAGPKPAQVRPMVSPVGSKAGLEVKF